MRLSVVGKCNVEHLDGGELVEHGPGGEAGCQRFKSGAQGDVKTIGDEGDKNVRSIRSTSWW